MHGGTSGKFKKFRTVWATHIGGVVDRLRHLYLQHWRQYHAVEKPFARVGAATDSRGADILDALLLFHNRVGVIIVIGDVGIIVVHADAGVIDGLHCGDMPVAQLTTRRPPQPYDLASAAAH